MGGGGGGSRWSLGDIGPLEEKAKEELRRGAEGRRNVFLSFAHEDLNEVNLLRGQARNEASNIEFNDWSVREPYESRRADYIKQKIGDRIGQASMTVVYVSDNTVNSAWVNWEVEESIRREKRVIAVHAGDRPPRQLPDVISRFRVKVIPWSRLGEEILRDA